MKTCRTCQKEKREYEFRKGETECKECARRVCPQCKKSLSSSHHLKQHINNVHNKIKAFKCEYCDFRASQKSNLRLHSCYYQRRKTVSNGVALDEAHYQKG